MSTQRDNLFGDDYAAGPEQPAAKMKRGVLRWASLVPAGESPVGQACVRIRLERLREGPQRCWWQNLEDVERYAEAVLDTSQIVYDTETLPDHLLLYHQRSEADQYLDVL